MISRFAGARRRARGRGEDAEEHGDAQHAGPAVMWLSVWRLVFLSRPLVLGARPHPRTATETHPIKLQPPDSPPSPASHAALLYSLLSAAHLCRLIAQQLEGRVYTRGMT